MRARIQYGVRCTNCGDEIYSNARPDTTYCHCGWWEVGGGFTDHYIAGPGQTMTEPEVITRYIEDPRTLPYRYRDEVPGRKDDE
jgi:hypothetical protein